MVEWDHGNVESQNSGFFLLLGQDMSVSGESEGTAFRAPIYEESRDFKVVNPLRCSLKDVDGNQEYGGHSRNDSRNNKERLRNAEQV